MNLNLRGEAPFRCLIEEGPFHLSLPVILAKLSSPEMG